MLVLLVGTLSEILLIAHSWEGQMLRQSETEDVSTSSLTLAGVSSFVVHLATASGSLPSPSEQHQVGDPRTGSIVQHGVLRLRFKREPQI